MFREVGRKKQALSKETSEAILNRGTWGVLSVSGDGGYPYGVPVNYAYVDGTILFHGAIEGHRWDSVKRSNKVCFTVVAEDEIVEEDYTTAYASVILFGRIRVLEDAAREEALLAMTDRLAPHVAHEKNAEVAKSCDRAAVFAIKIEQMTGKVGYKKIEHTI